MDWAIGRLLAVKDFAIRHQTLVSFGAAFVVYALFTLFYMGDAATHCTQSLLVFPGDHTSGLIALFSIDSHDPWFGRTDFYSYPYGQSLGAPTHITAQVLFIPFWAFAKLFGPICGFNLLCILGFMSAALVMFGFVRWLVGKTSVALLAGFAVAFTPYLQIKTGVHVSYVYEGLLVAAVWMFLLFWKSPSWKRAALLGFIIALFAYTDGYFILLGGVLLAAMFGGTLLYALFKNRWKIDVALRHRLKLLGVSILTILVMIIPVLYVIGTSANEIAANIPSTRASIKQEAQVYSARPLEYLLPNAFNPLFKGIFGSYDQRNNHGSNSAENIISLSLTLLSLATFWLVRVYQKRKDTRPMKLGSSGLDATFVAVVFGAVFVAALLCSFPPKFGPLPMPSDVIIHITAFWRAFARLSVVVNIGLVVLASCGLALLLDSMRSRSRKVLIYILVFMLVFVEYLTFVPPRQTSGYEKVPQLYYWLRSQTSYADIAEYPLDEYATSSYPVYYLTYERIDGKKLLNGTYSGKDAVFARAAVRDLLSPQAVPALRTLGIDFITIHSPDFPGNIPGLQLKYRSPEAILPVDGRPSNVWGYAVLPGKQATYVVAPTQGFHAPIRVSQIHQIQETGSDGVLSFKNLNPRSAAGNVPVTLQLKALPKAGQEVAIMQDKVTLWRGVVPASQTIVHFSADPSKDVHILAIKPVVDATLWLSQIAVDYSE